MPVSINVPRPCGRRVAGQFATLGGLFHRAKADLDAPALTRHFARFGLSQGEVVRHEADRMFAIMQHDQFQNQWRLAAALGQSSYAGYRWYNVSVR